jgi:hypothetical protein
MISFCLSSGKAKISCSSLAQTWYCKYAANQ